MKTFDQQVYASLLVKGKIHEAIDYLAKFPEKSELVEKYKCILQREEMYGLCDNALVNKVNGAYQVYYKDIFWAKEEVLVAEEKLLQNLNRLVGNETTFGCLEEAEEAVKQLVNDEKYEFLGGKTGGYYGPYIWASTEEVTYQVELPYGRESYTVNMMDGFVARSWLDFLSLGAVGTGGWAKEDGRLSCVRSSYDTESDNFNISFLKHEAQHAYDKREFPDMKSTELEYRAKLVELIYWEGDKIMRMLHLEADDADEKNSHSMASYQIISDLSKRIFDTDYENDVSKFMDALPKVREEARLLLIK